MGDKETTDKKLLTEDKFMELLGEHYYAIEELVKTLEDRVSYRVYNGVKAELRRQLGNREVNT